MIGNWSHAIELVASETWRGRKTVETVEDCAVGWRTLLKQGINEMESSDVRVVWVFIVQAGGEVFRKNCVSLP